LVVELAGGEVAGGEVCTLPPREEPPTTWVLPSVWSTAFTTPATACCFAWHCASSTLNTAAPMRSAPCWVKCTPSPVRTGTAAPVGSSSGGSDAWYRPSESEKSL